MYRLSLIISEIYNKYLPLAEKDGIILNLDFSDATKEIADPERVKKFLDEHLSSTLQRSDKGEVTIGVDKSAITITDSATTLSHAACALLSNRYIDVTSHVGFGTTVKIFFQPQETLASTSAKEKPPIKVDSIAADVSVDNNAKKPSVQTAMKIATSKGKQKTSLAAKLKLTGKTKASSTKPTRAKLNQPSSKTKSKSKKFLTAKLQSAHTKRQLATAAKKADKEVKRIAKKAQKLAQKPSKTAPKSSTEAKTSRRTKKKIELS